MNELERRRAPRSLVEMDCTLTRRIGSPITGTTLDLGAEGMSVVTNRPLAVDEERASTYRSRRSAAARASCGTRATTSTACASRRSGAQRSAGTTIHSTR
jgi:hypothetical protein